MAGARIASRLREGAAGREEASRSSGSVSFLHAERHWDQKGMPSRLTNVHISKATVRTKIVGLPEPHPLDRSGHIRHPEPDRLAQLEIGDQPGHAPVVELAAADLEVGGEVLLGHEVEFGARRRWVRVHARYCRVNWGSGR